MRDETQRKRTAVGGIRRDKKSQKPLIHKAQTKQQGIPTWGYPWGYPKTIKDRSFPGGIILEKVDQSSEQRLPGSNLVFSTALCRMKASFTDKRRAGNFRRGVVLGKRTLIYLNANEDNKHIAYNFQNVSPMR